MRKAPMQVRILRRKQASDRLGALFRNLAGPWPETRRLIESFVSTKTDLGRVPCGSVSIGIVMIVASASCLRTS